MSEERNWKRIRERLPLTLPVRVRGRETPTFEWSEVTKKLDPKAFTLKTMRARLDAKGDLAAPIPEGKAQLAKAIARLKQ